MRADNADARLTELGYNIGCVSENRYSVFKTKEEKINKFNEFCLNKYVSYPEIESLGITVKHNGKKNLKDLLAYQDVSRETIIKIAPESKDVDNSVYEQVEIDAKYSGYLKREYEDIAVFKRDENLQIRDDINYAKIGGLSTEMIQRFSTVKPNTIGEAARIKGVTPAAVTAILGYLKK